MADHRAEQILAAFTTACTGLATTGSNVQRDQVDPVESTPALSIEMGADTVVEGSDRNMGLLDSVLDVEVMAYVKNSTGLSTQLNQIRKEVHAAIYADTKLGLSSIVIDTGYTGAGDVIKSGDLEKEAAQQVFHYQVWYRHSLTDASA